MLDIDARETVGEEIIRFASLGDIIRINQYYVTHVVSARKGRFYGESEDFRGRERRSKPFGGEMTDEALRWAEERLGINPQSESRYSELDATRKKAGVPFATAYVPRRPPENIVVCSYTIEKYGWADDDGPVSLPWDTSSDTLGQKVWEALLKFGHTRESDPTWVAHTDWPTYRASGYKNLEAFMEECVRVDVCSSGLRPHELCVEASVPNEFLPPTLHSPPGAARILVGRHIGAACDFEALGDLIRLLSQCGVYVSDDFQFKPYRTWQKH
jgi:hypothetical protein